MSKHRCERCQETHEIYDVLHNTKEELYYLFCATCAHHMIFTYDDYEFKETVAMEDVVESKSMKEHLKIQEPTPEEIEAKRQKEIEEKINRAFRVMDQFVGMTHIKDQLRNLLVQKHAKEYLREHTNLKIQRPLMHTILTGSSGTGKTELAKKLARIFYDAGIIENKRIVFAKAEDLIGKYVGHTGPQTKAKIDEAEGGIFFLDEAYRLAEGGSKNDGSDYGLEAIQTIMGAMENNSNVVFVFAGYPDKMQNFLEKNQGLSSRIPNRLNLHDYTEAELQEIAFSYLHKKNYKTEKIQAVFVQHLREQMTHGMLKGNGRTVRNFADQLINKHLERVIALPSKQGVDLEELLPEDVQAAFEKATTDQARLKEAYQLAKNKINQIIGLKEVKEQLAEIGDYQYIQAKRKKAGLSAQKKSHHMFFLGEPGTGKTTMARLVGELFRGSGVLSNGHFIEATKEKLTKGDSIPTTVQGLINQAKGGVLFIDEAYALANDGKGKEALDSLIAHMENERDDLVVIMAGYKKDMQRLLNLNEGLASRVPYHFEFASYTAEELVEIAFDLFQQHQFLFTQEASEALIALIHASKETDTVSGNARWVRNLFEQIQLIQSKRLVQSELQDEDLSKEAYQTILLSDIETAKEKLHIFSSSPENDSEEKAQEKFFKKLEKHMKEMEEAV